MTESRTGFNALPGAGRTRPQFGEASRTPQERAATQFEHEPSNLLEWLGSPQARQLEGRWVLLSDDFEVLDYAQTLTELKQRNPEVRTPIIVFVDRPNTNLIA
jgi:hypothetical protein